MNSFIKGFFAGVAVLVFAASYASSKPEQKPGMIMIDGVPQIMNAPVHSDVEDIGFMYHVPNAACQDLAMWAYLTTQQRIAGTPIQITLDELNRQIRSHADSKSAVIVALMDGQLTKISYSKEGRAQWRTADAAGESVIRQCREHSEGVSTGD